MSGLQELIVSVREQAARRRDLVCVADSLEAFEHEGELVIGRWNDEAGQGEGVGKRLTNFYPTATANRQIASKLDIPKRYYDRLLSDDVGLLVDNINRWMPDAGIRTLRTLDPAPFERHGTLRAFLSNTYKPLDNVDLLAAILPRFEELGLEITKCNLSETHMTIKAAMPGRIASVPKVGDRIQAGIAVGNSEVGLGELWISEFDTVLSCLNGMIGEKTLRKRHAGGRSGVGVVDDSADAFSDETKRKTTEAFWSQVGDVIEMVLDEERFASRLCYYSDAMSDEAPERPARELVNGICSKFSIPVDDREKVLERYLRGGQETRWGIANALTSYAQELEDHNAATDLEVAGHEIVTSTWKALTAA